MVWYKDKLWAEGDLAGEFSEKDGKIEKFELKGEKLTAKGSWTRQGKVIPLEGPSTLSVKLKEVKSAAAPDSKDEEKPRECWCDEKTCVCKHCKSADKEKAEHCDCCE